MEKSLTNTIYSLYIINKAGGLIYQKVPLSLSPLATHHSHSPIA